MRVNYFTKELNYLIIFLCFPSIQIYAQCLSGNCQSGQGEKVYPDGGRFRGVFQNGVKKQGCYTYPNGDVYKGLFHQNKRSGVATYAYANGDLFEGEYLNDQKYHGRLMYKNGDVYLGFLENNKPEGFGSVRFANGKTWEGCWSKGKRLWGGYAQEHAFAADSLILDSIKSEHLGSAPIPPRVFAVIVGVADYVGRLADLRYSDDDARWFYEYLIKAMPSETKKGGVKLLLNEHASQKNIVHALESTFSQATENDFVIFYFSGHGDKGLFCPADFPSASLSHVELKSHFKKTKAKYKLCIADACFSGSIVNKPKADSTISPSVLADLQDARIAVVMSSKPNQLSQEYLPFKQGVFSYYLIKGLQGSADLNHDSYVTAAEAFLFTRNMVAKKTLGKQTPFIMGKNLEKMPLARIRRKF